MSWGSFHLDSLMLLLSFPWLGAMAAVLSVLDSLEQVKAEMMYSAAVTGEAAGGLVLVCGSVDWERMEAFPPQAFRLVCVGCVPLTGTTAEAAPALGVEEGGVEEEKEETSGPSGDANPPGADAASSSSAAAEAGRLRRRASAALQNKVFDPGRG